MAVARLDGRVWMTWEGYKVCPSLHHNAGDGLAEFQSERELGMTVNVGPVVPGSASCQEVTASESKVGCHKCRRSFDDSAGEFCYLCYKYFCSECITSCHVEVCGDSARGVTMCLWCKSKHRCRLNTVTNGPGSDSYGQFSTAPDDHFLIIKVKYLVKQLSKGSKCGARPQ